MYYPTSVLQTGITAITPQTLLADIIPHKNRRQTVNDIEKTLGFGINILEPKSWIVSLLTVILLTSLVTFFFDWKLAILGLSTSIVGFYIADYFGKELKLETVREAAEQITHHDYSKVRRKTGSINESEIEKVLLALFLDTLPYKEEELADFTI